MNSLTNLISPLDDLELICEEHGIPCVGFCSEVKCKNEFKFFCMKCIKEGKTCIIQENHELITISELLNRYFIKEGNKQKNITQIKIMSEILNDCGQKQIDDIINNFGEINSNAQKNFEPIKLGLNQILNEVFLNFYDMNNAKLKEIKKDSKLNMDNLKNMQQILNIKLPKFDRKDINDDKKLIEFMNSGYKLSSPKDFVNTLKFLDDSNNFSDSVKNLSKQAYVDKITSEKEEKRKKLESKIDEILGEIEDRFDAKLANLKSEILISKNDAMNIITAYSVSKFKNDPTNLVFKADLCSNAHKTNTIDKVFCTFKSFDGRYLLVWGTGAYSLEFYDLELDKVIKSIPNIHSRTVFSCRHYPNLNKRIDYILTSSQDRAVKVWDITTYKLVVSVPNVHFSQYIYSASLLFNYINDETYIITSAPNERMKVFNFSGRFQRDFGQSDESTYFIDVYLNSYNKKYYIINANSSDVKSYLFETGELYKNYKGIPKTWHMSVVVNEVNRQSLLVESDGNGYIRVWDFDTANLLKQISAGYNINLRGICLWNDDFVFGAGNDYKLKLFDLKNKKFVKSFEGHTNTACTIDKIKHPKYGEVLISQALDGKLKLWVFPENKF